jgi:hypothetical protein
LALRNNGDVCFTLEPECPSSDFGRGLHLDLDLPLTGLIGLEDQVGIPSFNTPFCEADLLGNQSSHYEAHYASQVALRRLCANLHQTLNESKLTFSPFVSQSYFIENRHVSNNL